MLQDTLSAFIFSPIELFHSIKSINEYILYNVKVVKEKLSKFHFNKRCRKKIKNKISMISCIICIPYYVWFFFYLNHTWENVWIYMERVWYLKEVLKFHSYYCLSQYFSLEYLKYFTCKHHIQYKFKKNKNRMYRKDFLLCLLYWYVLNYIDPYVFVYILRYTWDLIIGM